MSWLSFRKSTLTKLQIIVSSIQKATTRRLKIVSLVVKKRQKVTAWPPETLVTSDFRKLFLVKQSHVRGLSGPRRGTFSLLGHLGVILGVVLTPNATKLTAVANELTG